MTARRMNARLLSRLAITAAAAVLLLIGLAYWWQGNLVHEIVGTTMFALLIGHNVINRWWYGRVLRTPPARQRWILLVANLSLLVTMLVLLVTSLLLSQSLFSALPFDGGIFARELHILAAYWAVVIFAIHLGLHWPIVMQAASQTLGLSPSPGRRWVLRAATAAVAAYGIYCVGVMSLNSKLVDPYTLDMWDFQQNAGLFFLNHSSIVTTIASLAYYAVVLAPNYRRTTKNENRAA